MNPCTEAVTIMTQMDEYKTQDALSFIRFTNLPPSPEMLVYAIAF